MEAFQSNKLHVDVVYSRRASLFHRNGFISMLEFEGWMNKKERRSHRAATGRRLGLYGILDVRMRRHLI